MTVNNKRVFYVKYLAHQIYADILKVRADVRLDRLENETPEADFAPVLLAAHAYQIGAARDELAPHFHVHDAFLRLWRQRSQVDHAEHELAASRKHRAATAAGRSP